MLPLGADSQPPILEDQSLRDGLQMESRLFSLAEKLEVVTLLQEAGFRRIQAGSFVHPRRVPQMADTDALVGALAARTGVSAEPVVSALILNEKGLERAMACGVRHVSLSASISDTHSRKNAGQSAEAALTSMEGLIARGLAAGLDAAGSLQCAFGCVWEGRIDAEVVLRAADRMVQAGARALSLADTTGMAAPRHVRHLVQRMQAEFPGLTLSLHLHDTRGLGLANMFAGYEAGVRAFDVCVGGLGGCPFIKGAAGNVPAEDAVNMFEAMGIPTGIDLPRLCDLVDFYEARLERQLPGRMRRVFAQGHSRHAGA